VLKRCDCKCSYQDKRYGRGMRVHNECKNGEKGRCATCLDEKPITGGTQHKKRGRRR